MRTRAIALLAGLLLLVTAAPASATADIQRLAGATRYDTAAAVNCCNPDGTQRSFTTVVLASGAHFKDALLGSFVAGLDGGILMLTDGVTVAESELDLLRNAGAATVSNLYVMGGTAAVEQSAIDQVSAALGESGNPVRVNRVAGETAIDTSIAAARLRPGSIGGIEQGTKYAIVATVDGYADSLAAGPLAYSSSFPILFTRTNDLPPQVGDTLDSLGITNVLIVGGTGVISNDVASEISQLGINVQRLAGASRQETSVAVAEFVLSNDPEFTGSDFALARGDDFADALGGASHAAFVGAPILLTQSSTVLGFAAAGFLERQSGTLDTGWAYGGPSALSDDVLEAARAATATS